MNEQDMIHKLEKKFDFLESIYFERINERGQHVFSCVDAGAESYLFVDAEGWVTSRVKTKKFADVLGSIH